MIDIKNIHKFIKNDQENELVFYINSVKNIDELLNAMK
jgi:hypothetical protein